MINEQKQLSRALVLRLELYLEVLENWARDGKEFITSNDIGKALGISDVKVRQDLFRLGTNGKPKVGYDINELTSLIRDIFHLNVEKPICLVGCGNLGKALAGSNFWLKAGFRLVALFDNNPEVIGGEVNGIRIRSIAEIFGVIKTENIKAGVITVPASAAQSTADLLVNAGIRSIWNFAPVNLRVPEDVVVENQSLTWGLITLSYLMSKDELEV